MFPSAMIGKVYNVRDASAYTRALKGAELTTGAANIPAHQSTFASVQARTKLFPLSVIRR
jgi:hypothetical protein